MWFHRNAKAKSRCTYIITDAENISATQKLSELLNNMVAETFFITSFHLPCGCSVESTRQKRQYTPRKISLRRMKRSERGRTMLLKCMGA
jgi:hypothetical protein